MSFYIKKIRCHFFYPSGEPRDPPCPRGPNCRFVHPGHPDFQKLPPTFPPSRKYTPPRSFYTSPPRQRTPSPPIRHHRDSDAVAKHSSSSRESRDTSSHHKTSRRPTLENLDHLPKSALSLSESGRTTPSTATSKQTVLSLPSSSAVPPPRPQIPPEKPPPPSPQTAPVAVVMPPPPAVSPPPPLLPPPPAPPDVTPHPPTLVKELPPEDKTVSWSKKSALIADSARVQGELSKMEEDIKTFRRMIKSSYYQKLSEADRSGILDALAASEMQRDKLRESWKSAALQCATEDAWPIKDQGRKPDAVECKCQKVIGYVEDLKNTAKEIHTILKELKAHREAAKLEAQAASMAMDVDEVSPDGRPQKRQRLSADEADESHVQDLEQLADRITTVEARLTDFENDVTVHDEDLKADLEAVIDRRIEELHTAKAALDAQVELSSLTGTIQETNNNIDLNGSQIQELGDEIGSLMYRARAVDTEVELLKADRSNQTSQSDDIIHTIMASKGEMSQSLKQIEALQAAIALYTSQPLSSSPSSTPDSPPANINGKVEPEDPLVHSVHDQIAPLFTQLRHTVEELLRKQKEELRQTVSSDLELILRMIKVITVHIASEGQLQPGQ